MTTPTHIKTGQTYVAKCLFLKKLNKTHMLTIDYPKRPIVLLGYQIRQKQILHVHVEDLLKLPWVHYSMLVHICHFTD